FLVRRRHEHEREPAGFVIDAANFLQAELLAVEVERLLEVADAHHCKQIPHDLFSLTHFYRPEIDGTIPRDGGRSQALNCDARTHHLRSGAEPETAAGRLPGAARACAARGPAARAARRGAVAR